MNTRYKAGFLFIGTVLVPFLLQDVRADQEAPIPIAQAKWIAASEGEASSKRTERAVADFSQVLCPGGCGGLDRGGGGLWPGAFRIGDHFLDPPWSDYAETCYYVRFDVAGHLKPGENVLGVMLGHGMYHVPGGRYAKFTGSFGPPKLALCLVVSQGDKQQIIASDRTWKTDDGPITFSCIYGGEDYDARREQRRWDSPGFDDSHWKPVKVVDGPGGKLTDGRYEIDLGENLSARPVIKVKGKAGSQVTVETAERKGKPWQGHSYTYTLKGDREPEFFAPRFTYFGFQYLYISGVAWGDDVGTAPDVTELVDAGADFISSCGPRIGSFTCSNSLLNEINDMIDRSVASNLQHVLTDCPHREKLGWLEVAHLMGPSILLNYDMGALLRKICRDTTENGLVPDIAPEYVRFNGGFFESPEWGSACVQLPWLIHGWYGDERILEEQYPTMARYTDYLAGTRDANGLAKGGLGDWYDWTPERGHIGPSQLTPKELPATCMLYDNARILRHAATMQGNMAEARKWERGHGQSMCAGPRFVLWSGAGRGSRCRSDPPGSKP